MKSKLLSILLHPYFIALIPTLFIIFLIPDYFQHYHFELKEQSPISKSYRIYYPDLNNNGVSEKIICLNHKDNANFIIYDEHNNIVEQWNFKKKLALSKNPYWFFDTDQNGFKEIYFLTQSADSAFLNIVEPITKNGINKTTREVFIDTITEFDEKYSFAHYGPLLGHHTINDSQEVYFTMIKGFGGSPRNAYKYNFKTNTLKKSPHLTNVSMITALSDINNDGYKEVLFRNTAYGNQLDTTLTKRSDYSLWFTVLDYDLNFLYNPIEIKVPFSGIITIPFKNKGVQQIVGVLNSGQKDILPSKLMIFSTDGSVLNEIELGKGLFEIYINSKKDRFILFNSLSGKLKTFNFDLAELSSFDLEPFSDLYELDLEKDGLKEWINVAHNRSKLTIYRSNFKEKHSFSFPQYDAIKFLYGIKKDTPNNQFYVQNGEYYYLFDFYKNPYYFIKYVIYPLIYVMVLGMIYLIIKGQKIRTQKQRAIENEILQLQIKAIKNQVDPHFVFNAINTMSEMMLSNNKLEADNFICKFSELMRQTLQKSDKISSSLKEELEYVENYIQLQQIRFNHQFNYILKVDPKIDVETIIPKHVLYSYVENAIKHGLVNGHKNSFLSIEVLKKNSNLLLIIEDNGGGFGASKTNSRNSTGNGLLIMEKIFVLYTQLYKKKISHKIKEVHNASTGNKGVRIEVHIAF